MLLGLDVCSPEEEAKCKEEIRSEKYRAWACKNCRKKKTREIQPRTNYLLFLRRLQKGSYPFGENDLSLEEWLGLGLINEMLERR